jgi:hypothetical protein
LELSIVHIFMEVIAKHEIWHCCQTMKPRSPKLHWSIDHKPYSACGLMISYCWECIGTNNQHKRIYPNHQLTLEPRNEAPDFDQYY